MSTSTAESDLSFSSAHEFLHENASNDSIHHCYLKKGEKRSIVNYVVFTIFFVVLSVIMVSIGAVVFKNWNDTNVNNESYPHFYTPLYHVDTSNLHEVKESKNQELKIQEKDMKIIFEGMNSVFPQGQGESMEEVDSETVEITLSYYCCPESRIGNSLETCELIRKGMVFHKSIQQGFGNQLIKTVEEQLRVELNKDNQICPEGEYVEVDVEEHRFLNPIFDCFGRCSVVRNKETILYANPHFIETYLEAFLNSEGNEELKSEFNALDDSEKLGWIRGIIIDELDTLPCVEIRHERRVENAISELSSTFHGDADTEYERQALRPFCEKVIINLKPKSDSAAKIKLQNACSSQPGDGVCLRTVPKFEMVDQGKDFRKNY